MTTNLLIALANIIENPITDLVAHYKGSNRANNMGDALETYIKDLFCQSVQSNNDSRYSEFFSYLGNTNNPPDVIIRDGDAIEVKKIENLSSAIALIRFYPKDVMIHGLSKRAKTVNICALIL